MFRRPQYSLVIAGLGVGLLLAAADSVQAGTYHYGTTLRCNQCHTMHYSETHDYGGATSASAPGTSLQGLPGSSEPQGTLGTSGPYNKLLRNDVNHLCTSCHDGNGTVAPDVLGSNSGSNIREAGALNLDPSVGTNDAGYDVYMGHTLGSTATAPGGTFSDSEGLACVDCHSPHGGSSGKDDRGNAGDTALGWYRNLTTNPGAHSPSLGYGVSYAKASGPSAAPSGDPVALTGDFAKDVFLHNYNGDSWSAGVGDHYDVSAVDFLQPKPGTGTATQRSDAESGIGRWCKGCHTNFHNDSGATTQEFDGADWIRHPTEGSYIGAASSKLSTFGAHPYRLKVMSTNGNWGTQGTVFNSTTTTATTNDLTPTCVTCHKAHGNKNPFGLIYMDGQGSITEEGDAAGTTGTGAGVRKMCRQCHGMGGTYVVGVS